MSVNGISAVALLFMAALAIQSIPSLYRLLVRSIVPSKRNEAIATDDRDRLWNVGLSVAVGVLAVYVAHLGVLAALGQAAPATVDAAFTSLVLASGSDKISQLKSLIAIPGAAQDSPSALEVTGKVTVSKSDAW